MNKNVEEVMYVGKRTIMAYVMTALQLLNDGATKVVIKARGRLITKAVDVAEVLRNRFATDLVVESIVTGTEQLPNDNGVRNVSTIDITVVVPLMPKK